jgi:streptomycin 6-kinase
MARMDDNMPNNLVMLNLLLSTGQFHHATYRNLGTLWEGLWIYRKALYGHRGFDVATCFLKSDPNLATAESLVASTGVSVGSYGKG